MNAKKFLAGGIAGGIALLLLGWLIYGTLLTDTMAANTGQGIYKPMEEIIWWALILGNILSGLLLSYVLNNLAGITSMSKAITAGAMIGLLVAGSYDIIMYATANVMNLTGTVIDMAVSTIMSAIAATIVVWVSNKVK